MKKIKSLFFLGLTFLTFSFVTEVNAEEYHDVVIKEITEPEAFDGMSAFKIQYPFDEPITVDAIEIDFIGGSTGYSYGYRYFDLEDKGTLKSFSIDRPEIDLKVTRIVRFPEPIKITGITPSSNNVESSKIKVNSIRFLKTTIIDTTSPSDITNLNYKMTETGIELTYAKPLDIDFSHFKIYRDSILLSDNYKLERYIDTEINPLTEYKYKITTVDNSGNESEGTLLTVLTPDGPDLVPPANITDITHKVTDKSVTFNYTKPTDPDFSHFEIYKDNQLLIENHKLMSFTDDKLEPETTYSYTFKSVDMSGNVSVGTTVTIVTTKENDLNPPDVPKKVVIKPANSGLVVSWESNSESDLDGYKVYVDGVLFSESLTKNNYQKLFNLKNDTIYSIQVSAVDTSGNESEKSVSVTGIPNEEEMPLFNMKTNLSAVGKSTENWFSELWLIVAFASAIPLSFIIANRIKTLFIS